MDRKHVVREKYASLARAEQPCCEKPCCPDAAGTHATRIGYSQADLALAPKDSNLGLGCGNPTALAELNAGETVLDLGSGAGFDCFLAAQRVGPNGKAIGVDMTEEMISRAKENGRKAGLENVDFRLGDIEALPVEDESVDVVISNCVINLAPDKGAVFREAFRALKPGGRLAVSDIVLLRELPVELRDSAEAYAACVAGAVPLDEYLDAVKRAGFDGITLVRQTDAAQLLGDACCGAGEPCGEGLPTGSLAGVVASVEIRARKPSSD